jgi:transcriptional regulator GlxA family with amidase domain
MSSVVARRVAIVAYDGVSLLDLSGPLEALRIAAIHSNPPASGPAYECAVVSLRGGTVMSADGVGIVTQPVAALDDAAIDTLIVAGACTIDDVFRHRELVEWLRRRAPAARRVCSVCIGAFLLAEAGLLEGRRAVTHWMHCGLLSSRHPGIRVEPDAIYVQDGQFWTSAGVTAGIDLALALIEQDCGRAAAMHVARVLVVYLRRAGGQSQYSVLLASQTDSASDKFGELERWIAENLTADLRVERLAERVSMSPRNFARRYTEARRRTPARMVEALRVEAARRALEDTDVRIKEVARRCGFSNEEQLRVAFVRHLGITPRGYRHRFAA